MYKYILINIVFALSLVNLGCNYNKQRHSGSELSKVNSAEENKAKALLDQALELVYRPGENKTDLDSAILLAKQADSLNNFLHSNELHARACFVYSNAYREAGRSEEGLNYIKRSVELYKEMDSAAELGEAYLEMIQYHFADTDEEIDNRIALYKQADSSFLKANLKERHAFVLKNLGDLELIKWNYSAALSYLKDCESIYTAIHYPKMQGVYDLLGAVYTGSGYYNIAVKYGLMAVRAAENVNDTTIQLCTIYNRLGTSFYKWKKYEEAAVYFQKALAIATKYQSKHDVLITSVNLNVQFLILNRVEESLELVKQTDMNYKPDSEYDSVQLYTFYARSFLAAKKYDLAEKYVNILISLIKNGAVNDPLFFKTYTLLVTYFIDTHQNDKAQAWLDAKYKFYEIPSVREDIINYYKLKYQLDSAKSDFKAAFNDLNIYKNKNDSIFNETQSTELSHIRVEFETEKKDRDLKIKQQNIEILTNRGKLQEDRIKKGQTSRNLIMLTAILLISLFFTGYKIKQRTNRKLQLQQDEIAKRNNQLKQLLSEQEKLASEKEWLVKEIHHRVKNNLQIIESLLNTQALHLEEGDALTAIQESRHRMHVISLLHQKLYVGNTSSCIDMQVYIRDVVNFLKEGFKGINHIYFDLQLSPVSIDISQAVSVGLILNEAITNSIKYAFPNNKNGNITVSFTQEEGGGLLLSVADNGIGMSQAGEMRQKDSFGIQLMKTLSEQLDGKIEIDNKEGTSVKVYFRAYVAEKIV